MKRQIVELEREIGLTTPLIAELDGRLTGHSSATKESQSLTSPSAETSSSAEPTVKTMVDQNSSSATAEKPATAVDSGQQVESPPSTSTNRSLQVCLELALIVLKLGLYRIYFFQSGLSRILLDLE